MAESSFERLEELVVHLMRQSKISGISVAVVKDGHPVFARGFGARNREKNLPMTPDTLWNIASISKSFCAMAIMQLVEKGKVDLHAPVNKYIDFKLGRKDKHIEVHHLLSHSSGVPELDATGATDYKDVFIPMSSERDFMTFVNGANKEITADPGKTFMYNNDMYTCLGFIVEKVTNMKYAHYVKENILKPLGMDRSTYLDEEYEKDHDVVSGYVSSKDGLSMDPKPLRNDPLVYACGGLNSSVRELQNYMIALMNDGVFNNNRILEKSSIEKMWKPHSKPPKRYGKTGYGYGWGIRDDFFGYTLVHHGGNIATSGGFLAMVPEKKLGVVVGQIPNPTQVHSSIARDLLANLMGQDINEAVPELDTKKRLEALEGKYKSYGGSQIELSMRGGVLYAKLTYEGEKGYEMTAPLAVKDLKKLKFSVPYAIDGMELEVQGVVDRKTRKITLKADRYYFHKT
jgi:CubicO group peptidase (beta-lactamase class C family)